jgi:hypothetical protein
MLLWNLSVESGLANGSCGIITRFVNLKQISDTNDKAQPNYSNQNQLVFNSKLNVWIGKLTSSAFIRSPFLIKHYFLRKRVV